MFLQAKDIAYRLPHQETLLTNINLVINKGDKIALVGPNGSGKTTLLKILAKLEKPTYGKLESKGRAYYLPQVTSVAKYEDKTVYDLLNAELEDWWEALNIMERLGSPVKAETKIKTLSGGEITKLYLAVGLALKPDLLLLDEPTNHMDLTSKLKLAKILNQYKGAVVIVSHQPYFLDQVVRKVWQLENKGLNSYGGNYSFYREQKKKEELRLEQEHEVARKEHKKAERSLEVEKKRAQRSKQIGKKLKEEGGIPKIQLGYFADKADQTAGKRKKNLEGKLEQSQERLDQTRAYKKDLIKPSLQTEDTRKQYRLLELDDVNLEIKGSTIVEDIDLLLYFGQRILIAGPNGAGKSALVKAIINYNQNQTDQPYQLQKGKVWLKPDLGTVYVDQLYSLVDLKKSVWQNMVSYNKKVAKDKIRQHLARFLFYTEVDIKKLGQDLSGGELVRLVMAMVTLKKIDVLILDEPTNNLDVDSVEELIKAINQFKGALVVISHDVDFLKQISIKEVYKMANGRFTKVDSLPTEEGFVEKIA